MFERRNEPTNEMFLKICADNGIEFEATDKETTKTKFIEVVDGNGTVFKLTKEFNIFDDFYSEQASVFQTSFFVSYSTKKIKQDVSNNVKDCNNSKCLTTMKSIYSIIENGENNDLYNSKGVKNSTTNLAIIPPPAA